MYNPSFPTVPYNPVAGSPARFTGSPAPGNVQAECQREGQGMMGLPRRGDFPREPWFQIGSVGKLMVSNSSSWFIYGL